MKIYKGSLLLSLFISVVLNVKAQPQSKRDISSDTTINRVIERYVGVTLCEGCPKAGINVLGISKVGETISVKTIYASDKHFDFGANSLLLAKLGSLSGRLQAPFEVTVPIYFYSEKEQPSAQLIETSQNKIIEANKQATVVSPVVIVSY